MKQTLLDKDEFRSLRHIQSRLRKNDRTSIEKKETIDLHLMYELFYTCLVAVGLLVPTHNQMDLILRGLEYDNILPHYIVVHHICYPLFEVGYILIYIFITFHLF